jgi:hypothetical protein
MMDHTVEWFIAIAALVIGASHVVLPADWAEAFRRLAGLGRVGAFVNGGLTLAVGAALVAGHQTWTWPEGVVTTFGWLMVAKGAVCFLAPDAALRSMERGAQSPRGFIVGGAMLVAIGAWAGYCAWSG